MWLNYLNSHKGHIFCIDTLDLKGATTEDGTDFVSLFPYALCITHVVYSLQFMKLLTILKTQTQTDSGDLLFWQFFVDLYLDLSRSLFSHGTAFLHITHSRGQLHILSIHVTAYCNRESSSQYADVLFSDVSSENMQKASRPIRKSKRSNWKERMLEKLQFWRVRTYFGY